MPGRLVERGGGEQPAPQRGRGGQRAQQLLVAVAEVLRAQLSGRQRGPDPHLRARIVGQLPQPAHDRRAGGVVAAPHLGEHRRRQRRAPVGDQLSRERDAHRLDLTISQFRAGQGETGHRVVREQRPAGRPVGIALHGELPGQRGRGSGHRAVRGAAEDGERDPERGRVKRGRDAGAGGAAGDPAGGAPVRRRLSARPVHPGEPLLCLPGRQTAASVEQLLLGQPAEHPLGEQAGEQFHLGRAQLVQAHRGPHLGGPRQRLGLRHQGLRGRSHPLAWLRPRSPRPVQPLPQPEVE